MKEKSPENVVRVRYLGEEGIDFGALAREFFADTIPQIANTLFPGGAPVDSTLYVRNETFRTAGEIVATSLAQDGPPPNFLDTVVFETLVNFITTPSRFICVFLKWVIPLEIVA